MYIDRPIRINQFYWIRIDICPASKQLNLLKIFLIINMPTGCSDEWVIIDDSINEGLKRTERSFSLEG